jgi:hypothetical protein
MAHNSNLFQKIIDTSVHALSIKTYKKYLNSFALQIIYIYPVSIGIFSFSFPWSLKKIKLKVFDYYSDSERVNACCLMPSEQFFSYTMARTSCILMR